MDQTQVQELSPEAQDKKIQMMLSVATNQRNQAADELISLAGEMAILQDKLAAAEKELAALKLGANETKEVE